MIGYRAFFLIFAILPLAAHAEQSAESCRKSRIESQSLTMNVAFAQRALASTRDAKKTAELKERITKAERELASHRSTLAECAAKK